MDEDFLQFSFLGYDWITGGRFTMIIASIFVLFPYLKYHKPEYALIVGISVLPLSFTFFPEEFLAFAFLMVVLVLGTYGFHMLVRQSR